MWKSQLLSSITAEKFIQKCLKHFQMLLTMLEKKEKSFPDNDRHGPRLKMFKYFMLLKYTAPIPIILLIK